MKQIIHPSHPSEINGIIRDGEKKSKYKSHQGLFVQGCITLLTIFKYFFKNFPYQVLITSFTNKNCQLSVFFLAHACESKEIASRETLLANISCGCTNKCRKPTKLGLAQKSSASTLLIFVFALHFFFLRPYDCKVYVCNQILKEG